MARSAARTSLVVPLLVAMWAPVGCTMSHVEGDAGGLPDGASGDADSADVVDASDAATVSDAPDGPRAPDAPTSHVAEFRDYCVRTTTAICAGYDSCCTRAGRDGGPETCPTIIDGCNAIREADAAFAALADGTISVSPELGGYLAAVEAALASCSAWPTGVFEDYFSGDVGVSGDCTPSSLLWPMEAYRCRAGLFCAITGPASGGWRGECQPPGGAGAPCLSNAACSDGLYCRQLGGPVGDACRGRCEPQVGPGELCDDDSLCSTGLCIDVCVDRMPSDDWCEPLYGR